MGLDDLFKIAKLKIDAFKDEARTKKVAPTFEVQYNPDSLSIKHSTKLDSRRGTGPTPTWGRFINSDPREFEVDLVFDGTGVDHIGVVTLAAPTVTARIDAFLGACYRTQSATQETAYLRLHWGNGVLGPSFDCRLKSADITYTAFNRDGSPLHATMHVTFVEALEPKKRSVRGGQSLPDLTHVRTVVEGDTLPAMCREIYGSAEHHLRVAEVNGLDDLRQLPAGQELIFPPFASTGEE